MVNEPTKFLKMLDFLLSDTRDLARWSLSGTYVIIPFPDKLLAWMREDEEAKAFVRSTNLSALKRSINANSFKLFRTMELPCHFGKAICFAHPLFQRARPDLRAGLFTQQKLKKGDDQPKKALSAARGAFRPLDDLQSDYPLAPPRPCAPCACEPPLPLQAPPVEKYSPPLENYPRLEVNDNAAGGDGDRDGSGDSYDIDGAITGAMGGACAAAAESTDNSIIDAEIEAMLARIVPGDQDFGAFLDHILSACAPPLPAPTSCGGGSGTAHSFAAGTAGSLPPVPSTNALALTGSAPPSPHESQIDAARATKRQRLESPVVTNGGRYFGGSRAGASDMDLVLDGPGLLMASSPLPPPPPPPQGDYDAEDMAWMLATDWTDGLV
jgi:hypothetical protein